MNFLKFVSFFIIGVASLYSKASNGEQDCYNSTRIPNAKYCIYNFDKNISYSSKQNVIIHLHGRNGSELTWSDPFYYTQLLRNEWKDLNINQPIVITVSFGPVWILAEKNSSQYSGLLEAFSKGLLPEINSQLGFSPTHLKLFGESMGGVNALQAGLKLQIFSKVAALCTQVIQLSPFADQNEIDNFIKESSAWSYWKDQDSSIVNTSVKITIDVARAFFPTQSDWDKSDPFQLIKISNKNVKYYLSAGFYDPYLLYDGNVELVKQMKTLGYNIEWRPLWGGHCAVDIPSLAKFLIEE